MSISSQFNSTDPYHKYYDINLTNSYNPNLIGNTNVDLVFNEVRQNPIVMCPEEWFMSVVRFSIETPSLPVFIPQALLGQVDPNVLIYTFTLGVNDGGTDYYGKANWYYLPQDLSIPVAQNPVTFQQNSEYYYVYSFSAVTLMMNEAMRQAFVNLNANLVADGKTPLSDNLFPFFVYDTGASKWTLNCPLYPSDPAPSPPTYDTYDLKSNTTGRIVKVYMNTPAQVLLSSFPVLYIGNTTQNIVNGTNYQIQVINNNNQNILTKVYPTYPSLTPVAWNTSTVDLTYLFIEQDYSTTTLWNPVQNIVFTTSLLPVESSLGNAPKIFNFYAGSANNTTQAPNDSNVLTPIMTDLEVQATTGDGWKPSIQYLPTAEYRMMDLRGSYPVSAIEISVFWKDSFGNLTRFQLAPSCTASIKIMFRRKDYQTAKLAYQ